MTRGQAIDQFCKQCIYDRGGTGTWRQQVAACTAPKCPLFQYRPVPRGHDRNQILTDFGRETVQKLEAIK